jgi:hypothetical protein
MFDPVSRALPVKAKTLAAVAGDEFTRSFSPTYPKSLSNGGELSSSSHGLAMMLAAVEIFE